MRNFSIAFVLLASCGDAGAPSTPSASVEKVKTISHGKAYAPQDYLVSGYVTILDFYADW